MSVPYYPQSRYTVNLGLNLAGMDELLAENFVVLDTSIGSGSGGSSTIKVNGSVVTNPNFNDTTPAAPLGFTNVLWQKDGSGNVSAYVSSTSGGTPAGPFTSVQFNDSGAFGGSSLFTFDKATGDTVIGGELHVVEDAYFEQRTFSGPDADEFDAATGNHFFDWGLLSKTIANEMWSVNAFRTVLVPTVDVSLHSLFNGYFIIDFPAGNAFNIDGTISSIYSEGHYSGSGHLQDTTNGIGLAGGVIWSGSTSPTRRETQVGCHTWTENDGTGTVGLLRGLYTYPGNYGGLVDLAVGLYIDDAGSSGPITQFVGIRVSGQTGGTIVNAVGIEIQTMVATGGVSYALQILDQGDTNLAIQVQGGLNDLGPETTTVGSLYSSGTSLVNSTIISSESVFGSAGNLNSILGYRNFNVAPTAGINFGFDNAIFGYADVNHSDATGAFSPVGVAATVYIGAGLTISPVAASGPAAEFISFYNDNGSTVALGHGTYRYFELGGRVLTNMTSFIMDETDQLEIDNGSTLTNYIDKQFNIGAVDGSGKVVNVVGFNVFTSPPEVGRVSSVGIGWGLAAGAGHNPAGTWFLYEHTASASANGSLLNKLSLNNLIQYNSINTVSNGVPTEYATVDLTAQGATIGSTTLYAVPASGAGVYRVLYYMKITRAGSTSGSVTLTLGWTDRDDSTALSTIVPTPANATDNTSVVSGMLIVDAKLSTNLTYATTYASSGGTSMQYKLRLKVEAL